MNSLLGLSCENCGREFDVSSDLSTVKCPSCWSRFSVEQGKHRHKRQDTTKTGADKSTCKLRHRWEFEYVGEYHVVKGSQYLELYYEPVIGMYIVTFRGGNPNEGRHWDRSSPPEVRCSHYRDALRQYLKFAEAYAPDDVVAQVRTHVNRELKGK
jgi:DNA-directed RNA polymerase subunit RPC12/RpoP